MKFALLGADPETLNLARAAAETPGHSLIWACDIGPSGKWLQQFAPDVMLAEHWEGLLAGNLADIVLVARRSDEDVLADQLRKLVAEGVPIVVSHPIQQSMLVCYELDMIRQDSGSLILPYLPWRWHPAVAQLIGEPLSGPDSPLGELEQIVFERCMGERTDARVRAQFARDVDLIRALCGDLTKLSALAPSGLQNRLGSLGVQLSGPANVLVRWSVGAVDDFAGGRIALLGSDGKATLSMPEDDRPWTLSIAAEGDRAETVQFDGWNPAAETMARIDEIYGGASPGYDWLDAARAVELAETIDRSLEKGRTIELYNEDYSEETTFKGIMASAGCGLLILSLLTLFIAAVATGLGFELMRAWPYILLGILVIFLLLQALRLVFSSEPS